MSKILIVVSGPDRVGKSTLIDALMYYKGFSAKNFYIKHHSKPPLDYDNVYDYHKDSIKGWFESGKQYAIFDRSWPCTYILERLRDGNTGHFDQLIDFEIELHDLMKEKDGQVVHLGITKPWHWSGPHHLKELREFFGLDKKRAIRDNYIVRMQEHENYLTELANFYNQITLFPSLFLEFPEASEVWESINRVTGS